MKRIGSHSYYQYRSAINPYKDKNGYLFAQGRFATKIKPDDLPEWYIPGYIDRKKVYVDSKNVVDMYYKPNDMDLGYPTADLLYVSFNKKIAVVGDLPFSCCEGWDEIISGRYMYDYLLGVNEFSDYDITGILVEMMHRIYEFKKRCRSSPINDLLIELSQS